VTCLTSETGLHTTTVGENGPPIVFLHGLFGQGRNWTQIAKAFADRHRAVLVDLPHHGRSSWDDHFDFLEIADQVAGSLSADDPVTLVGHSLGGKVAMVLALRHPELVARLCVVDVSPVGYGSGSEFAGYITAMQDLDLSALEQRSDAETVLEQVVPNDTVRGFLLQNLRRDGDTWRWQVNLDVLGEELAEVTDWPEEQLAGATPYGGPVLWIGGARSDYVRDEYAEAMDRWFPHNRRVIVKNAGHWIHSEQPEVFVEVLRQFLNGPSVDGPAAAPVRTD
jgi:pimeloyl-ACP methyl ester carboxylesterase